MTTNNTCPHCGDRMATRTSKRVAGLIEARRECKGCDYADVVLKQPAVVLSVRPVVRTTPEPAGADAVV